MGRCKTLFKKTGETRAALPMPTVVLLPNSNSNVSVFPFETQKEQIERKPDNFPHDSRSVKARLIKYD